MRGLCSNRCGFCYLPEGLVQCLLKEENKEALPSALFYHAADGAVASSGLSDGQEIEVLDSESATVNLSHRVRIDGSIVFQPSFMVSN